MRGKSISFARGVVFCVAINLCAQTAPPPDLAPSVRSLFPLGAKDGQTVEVEFFGKRVIPLVREFESRHAGLSRAA